MFQLHKASRMSSGSKCTGRQKSRDQMFGNTVLRQIQKAALSDFNSPGN